MGMVRNESREILSSAQEMSERPFGLNDHGCRITYIARERLLLEEDMPPTSYSRPPLYTTDKRQGIIDNTHMFWPRESRQESLGTMQNRH